MAAHVSGGRFGRRQFVKSAAVGVGAAALLPVLPARASRAVQSTPAGQAPIGRITVPDPRAFAGTTINLAVQEHTATDAIRQLSPGFEEQTGITVNFEQIPQQQMNQKQLTDLSTGTGTYDVIGWFLNPEYIENGWIESVDELRQDPASTDETLLALDDFYQPFLDWYRYKGVLYGLPFYGESIMMYYNTEEFERAGIAKAPETVEELEAACQAITEGGRMAGIALRASQEGNAAIYPFLGWLYGYGGFWADATTGEIGLNKPESIEAADTWGRFLRDYGPEDVASYFWNEVQLAMQQERAAIIMDATNFGPRLEDPAQSKVAGKVGYALLPKAMGPNGPRGPEQTGGRFGNPALAYGLSVPTTAKNKQAAWLFNQWATSPGVMLQTTQIGLRGDPTRQSSLTDPSFLEKYNYGGGSWARTLSESFDLAMPVYWPRDVITQAQLADVLGLALSQIVTGERSAEEAMTDAYEQSVKIQKQAGLLD
jgi:ABC-type glycerol-3-phosphate transport system substrate-binding protein